MPTSDYQPGTLIHNHPDFKYHQAPGLSSSAVKCFALQSPQHYYQYYRLQTLKRGYSDAMQLGTLVHALVLEPDQFERRYQSELVSDDYPDALRTVPQLKKYCETHGLPASGLKQDLTRRILDHDPDAPVWETMKVRHSEIKKTTVSQTLWDKAHYMRDAVMANQDAANLFSHGDAEVSVWSENDDGQLLKCRCDWLRADGVCADLKTCSQSSPEQFSKDCARFGYGLQDVHYRETLNHTESLNVDTFVFVAVESEPPYLCQVYLLDDHSRLLCLEHYHRVLKRLRQCQKDDHWPGYADSVSTLSLPVWHLKQLERAA